MRDKDLFKYLGCFVVIVIGYMLAWTAVTLDFTRFKSIAGVPSTLTPTASAAIPNLPIAQPQQTDLIVKGRVSVNDAHSTPSPHDPSLLTSNVSSDSGFRSCLSNSSQPVVNLTAIRREEKTEPRVDKTIGVNQKDQINYQYFRVCRALFWDIVIELGKQVKSSSFFGDKVPILIRPSMFFI